MRKIFGTYDSVPLSETKKVTICNLYYYNKRLQNCNLLKGFSILLMQIFSIQKRFLCTLHKTLQK